MHVRGSSSKEHAVFPLVVKKYFNISTNLLKHGNTKFHESQRSESRIALCSWTKWGA